jgi:hypothetical protein
LGKNQDAIKHLKIAIEINPNLKTDEVNIIINNSTSSPGALDIPDNLD